MSINILHNRAVLVRDPPLTDDDLAAVPPPDPEERIECDRLPTINGPYPFMHDHKITIYRGDEVIIRTYKTHRDDTMGCNDVVQTMIDEAHYLLHMYME